MAPVREDVEAIRLDGAALNLSGKCSRKWGEGLDDGVSDSGFVIRDRFDINEPTRKLEEVNHGAVNWVNRCVE